MEYLIRKFYKSTVLANLVSIIVIISGIYSFIALPKTRMPEINFNWVTIICAYPGATTNDVEKLVTNEIENAIKGISDLKYVSSTIKPGLSSTLIRFYDLDENDFNKRLQSVKDEVNKVKNKFPSQVEDPFVVEITSSNGYPQANLIVSRHSYDETLRSQTKNIVDELKDIPEIDSIEVSGLLEPELQVLFDPSNLLKHNINPSQVVSTISEYFKDLSLGEQNIDGYKWSASFKGISSKADNLSEIPIIGSDGSLLLKEVASIHQGLSRPNVLVDYNNEPAVMLAIKKKKNSNTIDLMEKVKAYVENKNIKQDEHGVAIKIIDDRTTETHSSLGLMQNNAIIGFLMILATTWLFLGSIVAGYVTLGIACIIAATFIFLLIFNISLSMNALLGIIIASGMLVDDAVVMTEALYFHILAGKKDFDIIKASLYEIFAPITSSVFTTIAAFLPLVLLPGILGKFMQVVPIICTIALLLSLIEAYWLLPVHLSNNRELILGYSKRHNWRKGLISKIRVYYMRYLLYFTRKPYPLIKLLAALSIVALLLLSLGFIKYDFFARDPLKLFYVSIDVKEKNSSLSNTFVLTKQVRDIIEQEINSKISRNITSYAGVSFTKDGVSFNNQVGQILVSLDESTSGSDLERIKSNISKKLNKSQLPIEHEILLLGSGPPTSKPISIKVTGNNFDDIYLGASKLISELENIEGVNNINIKGLDVNNQLSIEPKIEQIQKFGLSINEVLSNIQLLFERNTVKEIYLNGEQYDVVVGQYDPEISSIHELENYILSNQKGKKIKLSQLVNFIEQEQYTSIKHFDFKRTFILEADLDQNINNTLAVNNKIKKIWNKMDRSEIPLVGISFIGKVDDIKEAINSMPTLFALGIAIMYLIISTQFNSYTKPFLIIATIPLAFIGVIYATAISGHAVSLYTLYGVIALTGISINSSIVMISAANKNLERGMLPSHAILFAAKRRILPIIITSTTTIAGLFSLAVGIGGYSKIWGPLASAIVWGLVFSTILTLFVIPQLFILYENIKAKNITNLLYKYIKRSICFIILLRNKFRSRHHK